MILIEKINSLHLLRNIESSTWIAKCDRNQKRKLNGVWYIDYVTWSNLLFSTAIDPGTRLHTGSIQDTTYNTVNLGKVNISLKL